MSVYAVGDSIAFNMNNDKDAIAAGVTPTAGLAASGYAIKQMGAFFEKANTLVKPGDTVIISAGYNYAAGPIPQPEVLALTNRIKQLKEKGADVRILGLREENITPYYANEYKGTTPLRNQQLRAIATQSGASFAESSIAVANSIAGGEVHGNYAQLAQAALQDPAPAAAVEIAPPGATAEGPSMLESAKEKAGDWWSGAKNTFSNLGFSGVAGGLIGGVLALCIGNAFGGSGWFGTLLTIGMLPIMAMLGVKLGKSTGDIVSTSMGGNNAEVGGPQVERSGPELAQNVSVNGPDQRNFSQELADQGAFPRQRYAFSNVNSTQYGANYSPTPYYGPRPEQQRTPGWTYRS